MSVEHNIVRSLKVLARDGVTVKADITGNVKLAGGTGFSVKKDTAEANSFVIAGDMSAGANDPYYQSKYNEIINGSSSVPSALFAFSGVADGGYYLSTINGKAPYQPDGDISLVGGACGQIGVFPDIASTGSTPTSATVEENDNQLSMFDMCTANVDCEDYYKLFSRMRIINEFLERNRNKNLTEDMKLFKQYEALITEWNYLANMQGIIFKVYASDQYIRIITGYRMLGCDQPPAYGPLSGVFWRVSATLLTGQTDIMITPKVTATDFSKLALKPTLTTSTGSNLIVRVPGAMNKKDFVVVMAVFAINHPPDDLSSSSSSGIVPGPVLYNTFQVSGTFYNTHLGVPVTQVKRVDTRWV
jgi:hypothetical protein